MRNAMLLFAVLAISFSACASCSPSGSEPTNGQSDATSASEGVAGNEERAMKMTVDGAEVRVQWEDNESVAALQRLVESSGGLSIAMSAYGGFEQVGSIGATLPRADVRITTAPGDIVLYSGNQMVVFYGSNTWAYTRLGRIMDRTAEEMAMLLGGGNAAIALSIDREIPYSAAGNEDNSKTSEF